jgi:hypothetical protein
LDLKQTDCGVDVDEISLRVGDLILQAFDVAFDAVTLCG